LHTNITSCNTNSICSKIGSNMQICIRANWLLIPCTTIVIMLLSNWFMRGQWAWYYGLNLPPITPPGWVFGVAWTVIYILTTACALIVFNFFEHSIRWYFIISFFILNALLNGSWTYVFFNQHLLALGALWSGMLALTTWILIALIKQNSFFTALLLAPYALWTTFATAIAAWTWWLN
jgi:translocator protein